MKTCNISLTRFEMANFYLRSWRMWENTMQQSFWTNSCIPFMLYFFLEVKNFFQDQMVDSQNNCLLTLSQYDVSIVMKSKHSVHILVFGMVTSDSDSIPIWPQTQHGSLLQVPGEDSAALDQKNILATGPCTMPDKNLVFAIRKFLQPHHA